MNLGLYSGFEGGAARRVLYAENTRVNNTNSARASVSMFYAPPEATHGLISAIGYRTNGLDASTDYYAPGGPGACYRVPFRLTPTARFIPVVGDNDYIYIGADLSARYTDMSPPYGVPDSFPGLRLGPGRAYGYTGGTIGGSVYFVEKQNEAQLASTGNILLPAGAYGGPSSTVNGGDGQVVGLPGGGIIASGAGAGGGGSNLGMTPVAGASGGNVPAPWGTMFGGKAAPTGYTPGAGACLFYHGQSYLNSGAGLGTSVSMPSFVASAYGSAWVCVEWAVMGGDV